MDGRCTCGKRDCGSPGKHPRTIRGVKDASNDPAVVAEWARTWPETNWGLACGRESNVVVIDIDQKSGGFSSIDEYESNRRHGPLPQTLVALTGGGGRHLFFTYPATQVGNRVNWLSGVDVRSDGGYVILPPGTHISGGRYTWHNFQDVVIEQLPADVAQDIINKAGGAAGTVDQADITNVAGIFDGIPEGKRDDTLFRWASRLRRQHETDSDGGRAAVTLLVMAAAQKANFPKEEAVKCIESAFKQDHRDLWEMPEAADEIERRVGERLLQLKVDREARRRLDSADAPAGIGEWDGLLSELDFPEEDDFLVADLIPYEGHVLFSAEKKAGKTTAALNLAKSLLTGEPFIGAKETKKIGGRVGFMNFEVSGRQFKKWASEHGIDPSRLYAVNRRGMANPLAYGDSRTELAAELKRLAVEVLIIDPFLKAFTGRDENSSSEVNEWLTMVEAFAVEAGIRNVVLIAHAGKTGETARGSSALEGWPDSIIRLSVNDKTGDRYIKAFGRDVYLEKTKLSFDQGTRTLSVADGGGKSEDMAIANRYAVLNEFGKAPFTFTKTSLAKKMPGNYQKNLPAAGEIIDKLADQGLLAAKANGQGTTYTLTNLPPELLRQAEYDPTPERQEIEREPEHRPGPEVLPAAVVDHFTEEGRDGPNVWHPVRKPRDGAGQP